MAKKSSKASRKFKLPKFSVPVKFRIKLPPRVQKVYERILKNPFLRGKKRAQLFLKRRPHRSFRPTDRRDLPKLAPLPSNIFFSAEVFGIMRRNKKAFLYLTLIYVAMYTLLIGISSQSGYSELSDGIKHLGSNVSDGELSKAGQTLVLFGAAATGSLNDPISESQQVFIGFLGLFTWLTIVWYLRHRLAGAKVKVRDAIYNSGAPFLSTTVLALVLLFQAIPAVIAVIAYATLLGSGIVAGGIESMMFAVAAVLLVVLSLYWMTSTLLAMIIVTIPGTYPMRALSLAGDVVIGRRVSLLVRMLWLIFVLLLVWVFILVPIILLADLIPWDWLPVVPTAIQLLTGWSFLYFATYVYLLYRRMIDEPTIKA